MLRVECGHTVYEVYKKKNYSTSTWLQRQREKCTYVYDSCL